MKRNYKNRFSFEQFVPFWGRNKKFLFSFGRLLFKVDISKITKKIFIEICDFLKMKTSPRPNLPIFSHWTSKNILDLQQFVQFLKSHNVVNHSTLLTMTMTLQAAAEWRGVQEPVLLPGREGGPVTLRQGESQQNIFLGPVKGTVSRYFRPPFFSWFEPT